MDFANAFIIGTQIVFLRVDVLFVIAFHYCGMWVLNILRMNLTSTL